MGGDIIINVRISYVNNHISRFVLKKIIADSITRRHNIRDIVSTS